ncbi:pentapeptide repeat-containing protein [Halostreptopolyspora alba]|uniref:Pentapeptide repeat-containing protein n=1 Tax=Halostreptopolyspora alba TaxID=2487137 RepID=A0A3N0E8Q9_9ACTN|nr:pentapeptide repeat-containing protein [Nocardiopsaceae bacterium YIM 96095]
MADPPSSPRPGRLRQLKELAQSLLGVIVAAWAVAVVVVALISAGTWAVLGFPPPELPEALAPRDMDAIATRAFAVVAGLGGTALLVIHYRRQRTTENGEQREATRLFNERFTAAYTELGSDHAAVRLGAVHSLAHLADDAPSRELRQSCIDVLCAYLRMPYQPAPEPLPEDATDEQRRDHQARSLTHASLREVRHTVIRTITAHLRDDAPRPWQGHDFDFTGTVFDGGDFTYAHFSGGTVDFTHATFSNGRVTFRHAHFSGGTVNFSDAHFSGGTVDFTHATFSGGRANFSGAHFSGGTVTYTAHFSGGTVNFSGAHFSGGTVTYTGARFSGGTVNFILARFSGGTVDFTHATFSNGRVTFSGAGFSGGTVTFGGVGLSSGPVPTPGGLVEATRRGVPGVVLLPPEWKESAEADKDEDHGSDGESASTDD